jgi:hypothetical protein
MADPISVGLTFDAIQIRIGGLLHAHIVRSKMLGMTAWRRGESSNYAVEFAMMGGNVLLEYDSAAKFEAVLQGVERVLGYEE